MIKRQKKLFYYWENLQHNNNIEFDYHYNFLGILKMMAGGTPIPASIDIYRKADHKFITTVRNKKLLDQMADD